MNKELLRKLPKIDDFLKKEDLKKELEDSFRILVVDAVRETIEYYREGILKGEIQNFTEEDIIDTFNIKIKEKKSMRLRRVINATGTVIHTNLGRSLLSQKAVKGVIDVSESYNNLEYNIKEGKRGSRYSHIEELIKKITGAEAAMVVNNNAAAVMLVLNTLCKGKEAVVSRGQLVEIGGSFRVPAVMEFSGASLVEVGTTNRTHLYDYENAINENTGVLLKVHTSNFKIMGFTEEVSIDKLVELGDKKCIPVVEDIGSGVLIDFSKYGLTYEPTVQESLKKGIDVVTFSGDKMLGGPQAGIIAGKKEYVDKMKKNQLTRALRIDKMTLAALEATLKYYIDEEEAVKNIPTLNMILEKKENLKKKANRYKRRLQNKIKNFKFSIKEDYSMVGGGSMPTEKLPTYVIKVESEEETAKEIENKLRMNEIPIITRINDNNILLDVRTLFDKDIEIIIDAFLNMK